MLGAAPGDTTARDYWEYCCSCQNFWRINPGEQASSQCPVCERDISARFLCNYCNTVCADSLIPAKSREVYLSLDGTVVPGCPACGYPAAETTLDHDCESFQTNLNTNRIVCPFCNEKIATPLSFPASVAAFMTQYTGDRVEVSFDAESRQLVKATAGDFVLLYAKTFPAPVVLPNRIEFTSKDEFLDDYEHYYNCDGPFIGEIFVVHPAIVKREGRGWSLQEVGRLRIEPREAPVVVEVAERVNASVAQHELVQEPNLVCPQCGVTGRSHHRFCKQCGTPMLTQSVAVDSDQVSPVLTPSHNSRWLLGAIVALLLLVGVLVLSFAIDSDSTERKLKDAIARGNLIAPPNESAYDYYTKLQREGASVATLTAYRDELLPRLLQRPQSMLNEVTLPRGVDGSLVEWEESQKLLAWATELSPQDQKLAAKFAYCEGRIAYLRSRPDDAITAYGRASKLDPDWATPLNSLGALLNERRRYSESRPYLLEAIRRKPDWALPYNNLGTSYFLDSRPYDARLNYEKARELAPNWARPHAWLGSIAMKERDYCTAASELEQALKLATPNMTNWNPQRIQNDLESARAACAAIPDEE